MRRSLPWLRGDRPVRRVIRVVAGVSTLAALVVLLYGCAGHTETPQIPSMGEGTGNDVQSGLAVLDWGAATVSLPLDRYGMTPEEAQVVYTAAMVRSYQCQMTSDRLGSDFIEQASSYLHGTPPAVHWIWGRWDVPYIAEFGPFGEIVPPLSLTGEPLPQDDPCREQVAHEGLEVITTEGLYPPTGNGFSGGSLTLSLMTLDAYDAASVDQSYLKLMAERDACIERAGYSVLASSDGGGVAWSDRWTGEQALQASIVEAKCADDMSYTQLVGDIFASYQMEYIARHEAELAAVKKEADATVARAREVLRAAGIE